MEYKNKHGSIDNIDFLPDLQKKTKYNAAELDSFLPRLQQQARRGECYFITFRALALVQDPSALHKIKEFMDSETSVSIILLVKTFDDVLKTELNSVCDTLDCHRVWLEIDSKHSVFTKTGTRRRTESGESSFRPTALPPKDRKRAPYNQYEGADRNRYRNRHLQRPSLASGSSPGSTLGIVFALLAVVMVVFNNDGP